MIKVELNDASIRQALMQAQSRMTNMRPLMAGIANKMLVSIHSRLFKPGEYALIYALHGCRERFQSTPDYLNRENNADSSAIRHRQCFNPLPII